ncbi:MAG: hypothetical protein R3A80_03120 [Bdellovibrionota bacterium]
MQLTDKLKKAFNKSTTSNISYWSFMAGVCSIFALSSIAEGAPKFLSTVKNGDVEATYKHDRQFSFSREENDVIIKKILSQLPLAQSATIVSSSPTVKTPETKIESLGYSYRNLKQVHMVSVSFVRTDFVPTLYFQVTENWKDCEGNPQYCQEEVEFNISGPSRVVRDLSDFGAFPKSLNVLKAKVKLANNSGTSFGANSSPATVSWAFSSANIENGVEEYLRYFRGKASAQEEKITLKNLKQSMALWSSQVSKQAFSNL